jgi:outer membrane receptor protein involved in Fe transport
MNIFKYLMSLLVITSFSLGVIAQEEDSDVEEVVVTGSKIKSADLYSFAPVTEITAEDIAVTGKASIGEILLELPSQGSGLSRNYNNGGSGAVRIDMRHLGSGRNLILVDGRRWVNSGQGANGSVDLNSIPSAMVERVEILRDGASAVYGSDAIAGVINIITKSDYTGTSATYQMGEYFDGGGESEVMTFTVGESFGKASYVAGVSIVDLEDLSNAARPETNAAPSFGGSSGTPQGRFAYSGVVGDCSNFTVAEGTAGTNAATDFRCWTSPDDRFNYNPYNYIETPSKRLNAFAKMTRELDSGQTVRLDFMYQKRDSDRLLAPMPLFYGFGDFGGNEGIGAGNPYNPFGIEFCDLNGNTNDGRTCDDETLGAGNYAVGWFGRRMLETGNRLYTDDIETYRAMASLDGEMMGFDYTAYFSKATNNALNTTDGLLDTGAVKRALASDCGPDGNGVTCLNIFGGQGPDSAYIGNNLWSGSGSITPEMARAISFQAKSSGGNQMTNYGVDFNGELFVNPQGFDVPVAFGYEHRQEDGFNFPDAFIAKGLSSGNANQPVSGGFEVDELYGELVYKVHEMVDFTVASRYSDYSTFGSTTNSKFGVLVQPTADLKVRATFAEGFRAPSIGALYSGNSDSYPDLQDPCDVNAANFTGNADGTQVGQCLADGVPAGFTQPNTQIRITVGGNPNVMPEESESFNVGLVWQPTGVQGLNMFADYYDIEITNLISSIGAQLLLNGCYTGSNPGYCGAIDRLSTGFVDDLRDTTNNVGTLVTSGVEVGGSYGFATAYGDFVLSVDARSLDTYDRTLANGDVQMAAGYVLGSSRDNLVDFKMNTSLSWTMGDMFASATLQHFGEGKGVANNPPTMTASGLVTEDERTIDALTYLDLQYGMVLPEYNATVRIGVDNVMDEDPTYFPETFANDFDPAYRTWGSMHWYANVSVNF